MVDNVKTKYINSIDVNNTRVEVVRYNEVEEAELDEMWSFVGKKDNPRWLWLALEHKTRTILAFVFGRRKDVIFKKLKTLLTPFEITMFYTDDWESYERNIDSANHTVGKTNTQAIKRKNLTLRTRIKRLCRKTICFSKSVTMHDIVIGLVINIYQTDYKKIYRRK